MGNVSGSLQDRLYDAVVAQLHVGQKHQQHAPTVTGMLLELGSDKVESLLDSDDLLNVAVEKSLKSYLTSNNIGHIKLSEADCERREVGDVMYRKVEKLCPEHAAKITGMLLELDNQQLQTLLDSETVLASAVRRAAQVCAVHQGDDDVTNTGSQQYGSLSSDTEAGDQTLGDQLYEKVEIVYPDHAAKITGMLLEQPDCEIQRLLQDENLLLQYIHRSYTALQTDS